MNRIKNNPARPADTTAAGPLFSTRKKKTMITNKLISIAVAAAMMAAGCSRDYNDDIRDEYGSLLDTPSDDTPSDDVEHHFDPTLVMGADISLLPSYEAAGSVYRDAAGNASDALTLFAQASMTTMRVRLFVDPTGTDKAVVQDLDYVTSLCQRLVGAGFGVMLDFHYSDTWADPVKQYKPAAWEGLTGSDLTDRVYTYTKDCLEHLKAAGVVPTHIQVGNEITSGMIWEDGRISYGSDTNWSTFAALFNSGAKACREVCPDAKVILHIERPGKLDLQKQFIQRAMAFNFDFDVLGLSYYPIWSDHGTIEAFSATLDYYAQTYPDIAVMVCEFSYNYAWYPTDATFDYTSVYPATAEGQRLFTADLIAMLRTHSNVTGLFWWFAEENEKNDAGYTGILSNWINRGLFDNTTGCALPAMDELSRFLEIRE